MHSVYVFETQLAYGLYLREGKSSLIYLTCAFIIVFQNL